MNIQKISPWLALAFLAVLAAGCASAPQQPAEAAQPQEIANVILFFLSNLASFVTGEISDVDGGITMD